MKRIIISIVGPTCVGKSQIAFDLARLLNTEIISCDSRQFYKQLNIGTSKPSNIFLNSIKHHFINRLNIWDLYSVKDFEKESLLIIKKLFLKYNYIIVVGGSGLYEKSLIEGLHDFPNIPFEVQNFWRKKYFDQGLVYLQKQLKNYDPEYYSYIDLNNSIRLIRALSIVTYTKKPFSYFIYKKKKHRNFKYIRIGVILPRNELYKSIDNRVYNMLNQGWLHEAWDLYFYKNFNSLNTIGYKELFLYINNKITYNDMVDLIKKNTRNYAKKQITWFNKSNKINWFLPKKNKIICFLNKFLLQ